MLYTVQSLRTMYGSANVGERVVGFNHVFMHVNPCALVMYFNSLDLTLTISANYRTLLIYQHQLFVPRKISELVKSDR